MTTWLRSSFSICIVLLSLCIGISAASAQNPATVALPFGQTISATLGKGEQIVYTFDVPADQDVVTVLDATDYLADYICPASAPANDACHKGGNDAGVEGLYLKHLFPSIGQAYSVRLEVGPPRNGSADYTLTAYALTPQPLDMGETAISVQPDAPIQAYVIEAAPNQAFSIEAEDTRPDGDFLWVASRPYLYESVFETSDNLIPVGKVDSAVNGDYTKPLQYMMMNYAGGRKFHLVVGATGDYSFNVTGLATPLLDANRPAIVNVSYRLPLQIFRLQTLRNDTARIQLQLTKGTGAAISVYTAGNPRGTYGELGIDPFHNAVKPRTATIEHAAQTNFGSYLVVEIPYKFTRDSATVSVVWALAS